MRRLYDRNLANVDCAFHFKRKASYGGDSNRIDLAFAICALSRAVSAADIRSATANRDLSKKRVNTGGTSYFDRTLWKARSTLSR